MMQMIHRDNHPGQLFMLFLPIIDTNTSVMTCLYSTLLYISSHARHYGITPILTFDQAQVCRNCLSAYANNTADHMLSGKSISRAVHGHLLLSGALNDLLIMLMSDVFDIPLPHTKASQKGSGQENTAAEESSHETDQSTTPESDQTISEQTNVLLMDEVLIVEGTLYDDLMAGSTTIENLWNSQVLQDINQKLMGRKRCHEKPTHSQVMTAVSGNCYCLTTIHQSRMDW